MAKTVKVYVVSWNTESGDRGTVCFAEKPTDGHLTAYFQKIMPDEFEDDYRLVHWDVDALTPQALPDPVTPVRGV